MKKPPICFVLLLCLACTPSRDVETVGQNDEPFTTDTRETVELSRYSIKDDIRNVPLSISGKKRPIADLVQILYAPATYTTKSVEDSVDAPQNMITTVQVVEGKFFVKNKQCETRSLVLCNRGDFVDQEYYDLFFLTQKTGGEIVVADKVVFDGSQGQSSTDVSVSKVVLAQNSDCAALQVSSLTEGGDVNLHRDEWVEWYVADAKAFRPVLKLEVENTNIQDFESTQDETQNSSAEIREYEILETFTNGMADIEARYTLRENGKLISESVERYRYNGDIYVQE